MNTDETENNQQTNDTEKEPLKNYNVNITAPAFVDYSENGLRVQNQQVDITFIALIGAQNKMLMINNQSKEKNIISYEAFIEQMSILGLNPSSFFYEWYSNNFQE